MPSQLLDARCEEQHVECGLPDLRHYLVLSSMSDLRGGRSRYLYQLQLQKELIQSLRWKEAESETTKDKTVYKISVSPLELTFLKSSQAVQGMQWSKQTHIRPKLRKAQSPLQTDL